MKKILFVGQSLKVGGIERALIEQLNSLDSSQYSVDLFLFSPSGSYYKELPHTINVLKSSLFLKSVGRTNDEAKQNIVYFILRVFFYFCSKIFGNQRLYRFLFCGVKQLKGYDVAISYFHDAGEKGLYYGCNLFVLNKVEAKKRMAWIHSDYTKIDSYTSQTAKLYQQFDVVVNVSNAMKRKFDALGIIRSECSKVVYNCINKRAILDKAGDAKEENNVFTIITVGRLEKEKGTIDLLKLAKVLRERKQSFKWIFVGAGNLRKWCEDYIYENNLNDSIQLLGQIVNPYPLIKNASLLVSGSYSETFGLSIIEALTLGTPVVALHYDAIEEVVNESNGIVVTSFKEMQDVIEGLLQKSDYYRDVKNKTKPLFDYEVMNRDQIQALLV